MLIPSTSNTQSSDLRCSNRQKKFIVGAKLLASLLQGVDATKRRPKGKGQRKLENPKHHIKNVYSIAMHI
jgi:hypothetical protein